MISTLCAAFVCLNPNFVIDVGIEEPDGEKVLRRFILYPSFQDKITDCQLSRWSADAPPVIIKGGWSMCRGSATGGQPAIRLAS